MSNTASSRPRSIADLASEAICVQDGSNVKGILLGFHHAACNLGDNLGHNKNWEHHPIMILWLDKIGHLCRQQDIPCEVACAAYSSCKALRENQPDPNADYWIGLLDKPLKVY